MAQISIIDRINRRRIVTFGGLVLIIMVLGSILIMKNPRQSAAIDINSGANCPNGIARVTNSILNRATDSSVDLSVQDVTVTNCKLFTSGTNKFKSLTVGSGGIVTHDPIKVGDIVGTDPSNISIYLSPAGQAKKVDLNISGDLTLQGGGKIDVSGKGFPGGVSSLDQNSPDWISVEDNVWKNAGVTKGSGKGGSNGIKVGGQNTVDGAGGSHAGAGGGAAAICGACNGGNYDSAFIGPKYNNISIPWGSGSGAVYNPNGGVNSPGINGGGYVNIVANSIISQGSASIIANGDDSPTNILANPGGGAGGTIKLKMMSEPASQTFASIDDISSLDENVRGGAYQYNDTGPVRDTSSGHTRDGESGIKQLGDITLTTSVVNSIFLQARGGDSNLGGGGGGGVIIVSNQGTTLTIKKSLISVNRPDGASPVNSAFNPYALQLGDRIRVKLDVTNLATGATISDQPLSNSNSMLPNTTLGATIICRPDANSLVPAGTSSDDQVTWAYSGAKKDDFFSYECVVSKK